MHDSPSVSSRLLYACHTFKHVYLHIVFFFKQQLQGIMNYTSMHSYLMVEVENVGCSIKIDCGDIEALQSCYHNSTREK